MDSKELKRRYGQGDRSFHKAQLQNANLTWLTLSDADFTAANFQNANLSGAALKAVNFSGGANLAFANLSRVDLSKANLCGANLEGANLDGAKLSGAVYDLQTQFPRGFDPKTSGARRQTSPSDSEPELNPLPPTAATTEDEDQASDESSQTSFIHPSSPKVSQNFSLMMLGWVVLGAVLSGLILDFSFFKEADLKFSDPRSPAIPELKTGENFSSSPKEMTETEAISIIQQWNVAKAAAMGPQHDTAKLYDVLTLPALAQWQYSADQVKQLGGHWIYTPHQVLVQTISTISPNQILLKATIGESAQYYEKGKVIADQSSTDTYPMEFTLVRQNQRWLIQDLRILR
ncbi:MAG: IMS domain-containing protein [Thermosynechococcaceae cyanobacterium MS004]|nr:IMS domain-containing protein [Thermosynechococcaceae cyanobacterium MS004]